MTKEIPTYCGDCSKLDTVECRWKDDKSSPTEDSLGCEDYKQIDTKIEPTSVCGDCAFYKTPKCNFSDQEGYIKKTDGTCIDFYPDRHLFAMSSPRKPKQKKPKQKLRPPEEIKKARKA